MSDENVNDVKPVLSGGEPPAAGAPRFAIDKAVGIIALVVVAGGVGYWAANRQAPAPAAPPPPVAAQPAPAPEISPADAIILAEAKVKSDPTADNYVSLSLAYYRAGRFSDTINAAKEAIKLKPDDAVAWNNEAAGYQGLEKWDDAIAAALKALEYKSDFQLAKNNLAFSQAQKLRQIANKK
jgi:tetratricopeptide (TPR) repeat protein